MVAVGVSGGVDSSVAALLLKAAGYRVVGVSHRAWSSPTNPHLLAEARAEEVCRRLEIPFFSIDVSGEFRKRVIEDFARKYEEGLTPNPCVLCNQEIKFGLFPKLVRRRLEEEGFLSPEERLFTATGHYVRLAGGEPRLMRGVDKKKDQSYMLYRVAQETLSDCIFPLGEYRKERVLDIAEAEGLPTAGVGESQDICFIEGDYVEYIEEYLGYRGESGPIEDLRGRRLGSHRGYMHYTVGQRQGLGLSDGPWYVAKLDASRNTLVVARSEELGVGSFSVGDLRLIKELPKDFETEVMLRYNAPLHRCRVERTDSRRATVELEAPAVVTPGQSAVFYDAEFLLGGGFILP